MECARQFYEVQQPRYSRACGSSVFFTAAELNGLVEKWKFQGSERMLWKAEIWKIRTGRFTTATAFLSGRSSKLLYSRNMNIHPYMYCLQRRLGNCVPVLYFKVSGVLAGIL